MGLQLLQVAGQNIAGLHCEVRPQGHQLLSCDGFKIFSVVAGWRSLEKPNQTSLIKEAGVLVQQEKRGGGGEVWRRWQQMRVDGGERSVAHFHLHPPSTTSSFVLSHYTSTCPRSRAFLLPLSLLIHPTLLCFSASHSPSEVKKDVAEEDIPGLCSYQYCQSPPAPWGPLELAHMVIIMLKNQTTEVFFF
ncbi:hypothetical protein Q8A73_013051 [Channa argus]|nr:hypothetical protein Q8A73_013051 [Channa argus]